LIHHLPETLRPADLRRAYLDPSTILDGVTVGSSQLGGVFVDSVRWGGVNLAVVDW
jgi:hypothetical protein